MFKSSFLLILGLLFIIGIVTLTHAQIAFREEADIDKKKANLEGRIPLYSPARCKKHELLYPGDQTDDWICDCAPATLYHPESEACFPAFRRGPCEAGFILVLKKDSIIPECVRNACPQDNHFMIGDKCFEFGNNDAKQNPCPLKELTYVLGVNPKTLMVDCVQLSTQLELRFGEGTQQAPLDYYIHLAQKCGRGSRLMATGHCGPAQ